MDAAARYLLAALCVAAALANGGKGFNSLLLHEGPVSDGSVEVRVREGGRAVLPCRAGPTGTTGWRHRGEPVAQDPRYHFDRTAASLVITRARPSDSGTWSCTQNGNTVNLVVLESPRAPYLLIDSRRLDAGNLFVPVKENSRLSVECVVEGGSPAPGLHWLLLPPPGSTSPPGLNQQETAPAATTHGVARSVANIPRVLRAHHNSTVACIVTHPTLPAPLNASILLDVQFTPSFAITRVPGFGFPLREGIPVSLKCDVDSNPPSSPVWQKDDASPPVEQTADGYLNFTSIRREHSGWYKCTTRHLLSTYSSIGYFLNIRYGEGEISAAELEAVVGGSTEAATGSVEVSVGGAVQLECGGSERGCWGRVSTTGQVSPLGPGAPLAIHSVLYQQAGHYRCYAPEPDRLNAWRTHNVHLKVTGVPMVVAKNSSRTAETGESLSLLAEYCASPGATKVLWLLPTLRAVAPGRTMWGVRAHNTTSGNWPDCHKALLTIDRINRREHEGDFSLLVWSGRGIGQATIRVNVTGDDDTAASSSSSLSSPSSSMSHWPLVLIVVVTVHLMEALMGSRLLQRPEMQLHL